MMGLCTEERRTVDTGIGSLGSDVIANQSTRQRLLMMQQEQFKELISSCPSRKEEVAISLSIDKSIIQIPTIRRVGLQLLTSREVDKPSVTIIMASGHIATM